MKFKLRRLNTRIYLALGLSSLLVTLVLGAAYLGLIPDREALARSHRAALAETLAVTASALVNHMGGTEDLGELDATLRFLQQRNPEILTLGVRDHEGTLLLDIAPTEGGHAQAWTLSAQAPSTDAEIQVPVSQEGAPWGTVELRFEPLRRAGWMGHLDDPALRLMAFLSVTSFVAFALYLKRMLRHLDPSQAVPARVRNALDTLTEGLLVLDGEGLMVLANQSLARIVGTDPETMLGRAAALLPWTDREGTALDAAHLPWLEAIRTREIRRNVLMYLEGANGRRYTFRVNCSPIVGAGDKAQGVLVSFQDVTELEEKELALQAAKEEADAANRAKSDFLANMSHEIRTPMNAILGFTEVLRRDGTSARTLAEQRKHLDIIHSSGNHLLQLINDILDLSKVESGHFEIEQVRFAPHAVIREIVQVLGVKATEKGVSLRAEFPEALPATIQTDPSRLRQILTNLVGNAIKFTEQGGVTVRARAVRSGGGSRLLIEVADTGIGIPPTKLDSVFEPFTQAESSTTRRFGGTGLGLTISRKFARAMGGDITVTSVFGDVPGHGSVFRVEIDPGPLAGIELLQPAVLQAEAEQPQAAQDARWQFPPARVLVVDDGVENRELARVVLEEAGLQVFEAENGQVALDRVAAEDFDLVLMDMQMPVMDGATATRKLRERGWSKPVIALTANAMKGFERELHEAGFSGFQTKPIQIDRLLQDLAERLGGRRLTPEETPLKAAPAPADKTEIAEDTTPLVSRLASHPKLQNVVRKFVTQFPPKLASMEEALAAQRYDELAGLAHWLKGAGGSVGFDDYFEPSRDLETACQAQDHAQATRCLERIRLLGRRMTAEPQPA